MQERITWEMIVQEEPRLKALLDEILKAKDSFKETPNLSALWYGNPDIKGYKAKMRVLVGCEVEGTVKDFMRSGAAYDLVYEKLRDALGRD